MIYPPSIPPDKNEPAEEQVYNILKRLDPERYDVFYDRRFVGMRPGERKEYQTDFLVADLGDTGLISSGHVNITTIRTFKGLEADVVFIVDTDKMEKHDKRVLYAQASRARLRLGVFSKSSADCRKGIHLAIININEKSNEVWQKST